MPNPTYDAIVIGGGHNGLVAAAYLAKAGFHTLVLERYREVGGAAFSQEIEPGFLLSEGSYVLSLMPRSIIDDLDAWGGIQLIGRDPRFFMPFPDGRALTAWEDHDKFIAEIARFSEKDARAYDHYDAFVEKAAAVMDRYILSNPPSFAEFASNFKTAEEARIFQKMILGSAAEVAEYFFESEQVQAMACAFGLIGTFRGPRDAGTAYVKLYHAMGNVTGKRGQWAYVKGAMGAVTQAIANSARRYGAEILTDAEVAQVCIANGRVTGVVTSDGREFDAKAVLSNADPVRTYTKLVDSTALPPEFLADIEAIQITSPVMKINMALERLPEYTAAGNDQKLAYTGGVFIGPSIDYFQKAYEDARRGEPSDYPFFSVHTQSAVDPSVAPAGEAHALDLHPVHALPPCRRHVGRTSRGDRRPCAEPVCRLRAQYQRDRHQAANAGAARHRSSLRADGRAYLPGRAGAGAGVRFASGAGKRIHTRVRCPDSIFADRARGQAAA